MKSLLYYIVFAFWYLLSLLPLRVLYGISDSLYFLLYYCIRYRRKIVRKNLMNSFPEKELKEIVRIEKGFYSFFCDYVVETIKLFTVTEATMRKRMTFGGMEEVNKCLEEGKPCILYLGHYCNWEWISSIPLYIDKSVYAGQIYHPLENKVFDELFLRLRSRFGANNVSMNNTLRKVVSLRRENRKFIIGFISDQVPLWNSIHHWVEFLHQDTPVFTGTEKIAAQIQATVFYVDVLRPKRGYYHAEFKLMETAPQTLLEFCLTDMYFEQLEQTINRAPQYWLWSHNRWKRQRNKVI